MLQKTQKDNEIERNLTTAIDIVFLLIVFSLLGTLVRWE
jgi:hypothetical protein